MRVVLLVFAASGVFAQLPILYHRGTYNAASLAPFGLPNAPIARGSVFTIFGESLGPAKTPALSFPLLSTLGGVSISVTQSGVATQAYPIFISAAQINAVMPSTVTAGVATLRLTYHARRSNAITIQIADSAPGVFAISSGGYGPGVVMNYVAESNQPVNSLTAPAARGQVITIWGTGLGPVTFPDNVAPTAGNVAPHVTLTIGGQPATIAYSGRAPCCSGIDQIVGCTGGPLTNRFPTPLTAARFPNARSTRSRPASRNLDGGKQSLSTRTATSSAVTHGCLLPGPNHLASPPTGAQSARGPFFHGLLATGHFGDSLDSC